MIPARSVLIWGALTLAIGAPIAVAGQSPLLAWRDPIYIAAGFAGIIGLALLLIQPLLIGGYLPGISAMQARRIHRIIGVLLVTTVVLHVAGLWITSPPDVVDALLFVSPTPFSVWGVIAMWTVFGAAFLAAFRRRLRLRPGNWRSAHKLLAAVVVVGTVVHALQITGTMGVMSKTMLCALVLLATVWVFAKLKRRAILPK